MTLITVAHRLQTIIDADKVVSYPSFSSTVKSSLRTKIDGPGCGSNCELLYSSTILELKEKQIEFDKPSELLKMENSRFRSLVDESGDRDLLYSMVSSAGTASPTMKS